MKIDSLISNLTLQEISNKKEDLEQNILNLINTFEKETNTRIRNVNMVTVNQVKTFYIYIDFGI